ncbi:hypothetical protein HN789_04350 [archaeon]|jgi:ribonuclease P/MRP protein subunit POP5|nr:hypothetical protein [archaeon]MBT4023129.1 hypothetical protein [archaeon]MBT4271868.1 hypothetical protein [archaeon]MBT4460756.1 hypothetical protein [archaeon]MBT4858829.1 hypothetical protein [archaeon]
MKGKPLLPVLRTKKRYIVYETISRTKTKHNEVVNAIIESHKNCFGMFGLGNAGIMDTKIFKENKGILKVNNKYLNDLKTSIAMINNINGKEVIVNIILVSGKINKTKLMVNRGYEKQQTR